MTAAPRNILAVTDLSAHSGLAVGRAALLALEHHAQLHALYVIPPDLGDGLTQFAERCLRLHLEEHAPDLPVAQSVRPGAVVEQILAEISRCEADLVVTGAHGADWISSTFLGSAPANLVRVSPVPVLVVRTPPGDDYRTVILASDTSPGSVLAAETAHALTPQAQHLLAQVTVVVGQSLLEMHGMGEKLSDLRRLRAEQVRGPLDVLARQLGAELIIEAGRPQQCLPDLAVRRGADLIAVGAGRRSRGANAVFGSTALHVLREATVDVLVVPPQHI